MADNNSPPEGEGYEYGGDNGGKNGGGLQSGAPAVAAAPGKMMLILGAAALGVGFVLYSLFAPEKEVKVKTETTPEKVVEAPDNSVPMPPVALDPTPPVPEPTPPEPTPPVIVPPPPPPPPPPDLTVNATGPNNEVLQARIRSNMMVLDGKKPVASDAQKDAAQNALNANDPNSAFASNVARTSKAEKVKAGMIGNLRYMIAQGKVIHAVLETAINSDLPGSIRAIVSRDIFAEAGNTVLIPKGSRLIGIYNSSILRGQKRVFIVWNRVIRPDGIDVMIDSPGIDSLGRSGFEGYVDNKLLEAYSGAFLSSILSFGVAYAGEQALGNDASTTTTTTNNSQGSTTSTTSTPSAQALNDLTGNISDVTKNVVDDLLDLRPTITVDQGTRVNVFVNKDLIFPPEVLARTKMIQ